VLRLADDTETAVAVPVKTDVIAGAATDLVDLDGEATVADRAAREGEDTVAAVADAAAVIGVPGVASSLRGIRPAI